MLRETPLCQSSLAGPLALPVRPLLLNNAFGLAMPERARTASLREGLLPKGLLPIKTGVEGEIVRCAPRAVVSWCRGQVRWEKLSDARHVYRCCSPATPCTMVRVRSAASLLVRAAQRFGCPVSRLGCPHLKPISHLHDDSVPWTVGSLHVPFYIHTPCSSPFSHQTSPT